MLDYKIEKRDGTKQEFSVAKLSKWFDWAKAKDIELESLLSQAISRCPNGVSTEDFHKAMIDACVDHKDDKYLKVAARLLIGSVWKKAFHNTLGIKFVGEYPDLKTYTNKMIELGFYEKTKFSDDEIDQIGNCIDHSKDLSYTYTTIKQISDKYLIQDRVNKKIYETPQFMFAGIAMAICQHQKQETRVKDAIKLYTYLSDLKINAPTPYMTNLRTSNKGIASCCVFFGEDTADSIEAANSITYKFTTANAGIGGCLQTRSAGDPVRQGQIKHLGKIPYYKYFEAATKSTKQQSRSGAVTMYYTCLDPEVIDLLKLKSVKTPEQKAVRNMDYALCLNKCFMDAVFRDEDWMLISCKDAPDLYESFYSNDIVGFERLYNSYKNSSVNKSFVKAKNIANEFLINRQETGRVYAWFVDNANTHTTFKDKIYSSNLCVAPETLVLTKDGYVEISSIADKTVEVWNGEEWSEVAIRKTGENKKLIKIVTDSGQELECTPQHKFHILRRYGKPYVKVAAEDLKVGDKLIKFELPVIEGNLDLYKPYQNGFYTGDGCCVNGNARIYLYGEKRDLLHIFNLENLNIQQDQQRIYGNEAGLKSKYFVPDCNYTISSRLQWLAGWLDADGCIYRNNGNQQIVGSSINLSFLKQVQLMLQTLGISCKIKQNMVAGMRKLPANDGTGDNKDFFCQDSYRLLITSCDVAKLMQLGSKFHRLKLVEYSPQRDAKQFVKVKEVKDEGRYSDTYCLTEPKRNMAMFNGILTGNCAEISLPTSSFVSSFDLYKHHTEAEKGEVAMCFLAAICAGRVTEAEYEDVAYYTLLLADTAIDIMEYPFKHVESTAKARRSIGIGLTNVANAMARKMVSYSSKAGKQYAHEIAETHSYYLHKASLRLAKEKGKAEWMYKTKYPEGWLPLDTYNKNVDNCAQPVYKYDWESLRKEIIDFGGIRNSTLVAHMPCESSSGGSATTNGLYPIRDMKVVKKSGNNVNIFLAPDNDDPLVSSFYDIAWDVPTKDLIEFYAIVQKFTCQGISADFYIDFTKKDKVSLKEYLQYLEYSHRLGLKSWYYTNSKTITEVKDTEVCESCSV